ncbi:MAG TPA: PilZ domain-containing protein [Polyangiaceae bacterium]|nr:PilZ domain-containing protein [Polyangiaceae bacterium]
MPDERRGSKRAHISGVRVTYESANGQKVDADALDLSTGGLFVRTNTPLGVGKRITLEIQVVGEPSSWSALGRVVWVRPNAAPGMPAGMGVKLIDVEDAVVEAIDNLVETREPTSPGMGAGVKAEIAPVAPVVMAPAVPEREQTLMGVGAAEPEKPAARDAVRPAAGVRVPGPGPGPREVSAEREASIAIDLVSKRPESVPPSRPPPPPSVRPREARGGAGGRWVVILLLLVVAGIAAYVLLDGFLRPPAR